MNSSYHWIFSLTLPKSKHYTTVANKSQKAIFLFACFKNYLFFDPGFIIYHLESSTGLFTHRKYAGEIFMSVCQSDPWPSSVSPRKASRCCWVKDFGEEGGHAVISLQPVPLLSSHSSFSPHEKEGQLLTAKLVASVTRKSSNDL